MAIRQQSRKQRHKCSPSRRSAIGLGITLATCAVAVGWCLIAPSPSPAMPSTQQAKAIVVPLLQREPLRRKKAATEFPGDLWSQGDAFHAYEYQQVMGAARRLDVSVGSLLLALDEQLRQMTPERNWQYVAPCKPRPSYD